MKRNLYKSLSIFIMIVFASRCFAGKYDLKRNWTFNVKAPDGLKAGAGNLVPYPDAINPNSMIFSSGFGIMKINGDGKILFSYSTGTGGAFPSAVGDINGNGQAEIITATSSGTVHCITGDGQLVWKIELNDELYGFGSVVMSDIDSDGRMESLFNAKAGTLYCLNFDGSLRWQFKAEPRACSPAVGDIDGDGKAEIFYGTDVSKIFALNYKGEYLWHTEIFGRVFGRSAPTLADLDNDGKYELLMPHSNSTPNPAIVCLDAHSGKLLWTGKTHMQNYVGTTVVDLDKDGNKEVIVVDKGNVVSVFEHDGKKKWSTTLSGHGIFNAAGVADFDSDGRFEIICGCRQTGPEGQTMFLLDDKGNMLREYKEGKNRNSSPCIADLNHDGIPEIYFSDGRGPNIISYTLEGSAANGKILWPYWKYTSNNAGFVTSRSKKHKKIKTELAKFNKVNKINIESVYVGQNFKVISVPQQYQSADLIAEIRLVDNSGKIEASLAWSKEVKEEIKVPFTINSLQTYEQRVTVRERKSKRIIHAERNLVSAAGFGKDLAFNAENKKQMEEIITHLSDTDLSIASELKAKFSQKENLLKDLVQKSRTQSSGLSSETLELIESIRQDSRFLLSYAAFLGRIRAAGNKELFYVWEDTNPWDELKAADIYPKKVKTDTNIVSVLAMGNEIEAKTLYVTNVINKAHYIKVYPYDFTDEQGIKIKSNKVLELREAINAPDVRGKMVDEVIPRLNEGNTLYLAPFDSRKLWLNFNTKSLKPGKYFCYLGFEAVGMTISVQTVKLELTVSSVTIPEKSEFAFSTWSSVTIADEELREKVLADIISHKITVFPQIAGARFYVDENKNLLEDWSQWDKYYTPLQKHAVCMNIHPLHIGVPKGIKISEEERIDYLKEAYSRFAKGMTERGFHPDQWGVYVMDEPGLTGYSSIREAIHIAKEIKMVAPDVQCFIDPAGMVSPESMKGFEGLIDIYSPQIDLLKNPDGRLLNYFHSLNKRLWFYEAPSPARTFHPLGHYRVQPWLAFDFGLTGSGYWCYHYNQRTNLWRLKTAYPPPTESYTVVYNDGQNVIPSRRWEASRDGIEEYHLLMMLKRKIAGFKKGTKQQRALAKEAETYMNMAVNRITANVKQIEEINREFIPYDVDFRYYTEAREKLIDYMEKMEAMTSKRR